MEPSYLTSLNSNQRKAVIHGHDCDKMRAGPVLIIAGAGSGKTKTLSHRVAHLVVNGVDPQRILLLTFTRRAAQELINRAQAITAAVTKVQSAFPWAGTFHAIGAKVLREYADQVGLDRHFTILDREDAADLLDLVRHDLDMHLATKRFPQKGTCLAIYSRTVNSGLRLDEVLEESFPWCLQWVDDLQALFAAYVTAKQRHASLDYDDLLTYWDLAMQVPEIAAHLSSQFDHILVDEYQDTNALQASILLNLRPGGEGMMVVGDDAQSIYSFRAASVQNILGFPAQFSPSAEVLTLDRNYRSTQSILAASNAVISEAKERYTKDLWTERLSQQKPLLVSVQDAVEQAKYVAEKILEFREAGDSLKKQAVLFRASHHSAVLELELTRHGIPFVKFGGLKFLDAKHVKDMLGILKFAENPKDRIAAFRTLQLLPGIGPKVAGKIFDFIADYGTPIQRLADYRPPAAAAEQWTSLLALLNHLVISGRWPADIEAVRHWYTPILQNEFDDAAPRIADLVQLADIACGYPFRSKFLSELALDPPDATSDEAGDPLKDEDYLCLSTVHSAKGKEWKSVFLLNVMDGCFPIDLGAGTSAEIEEERRLLYVAMTRAKDNLALMLPQRWYTSGQQAYGDRHLYAARTRFITDTMLAHFEQRSWSSFAADALTRSSVLPSKMVDVGARMRERWK